MTASRAWACLLALCVVAAPATAQELTGVALGPDGQPLGGEAVALHRVGGMGGGAFVATDTTSADGAFRFELGPDSAVYFAAIRYGGRMYIGPAVQPGTVPIADYLLQVDPANEAGAVATGLSSRPQTPPRTTSPGTAVPSSSDAGALLLVGLLALGAATAFFFAAPRYRQRRTREALIELAAIENALADATDEDDTAELRADRDRLRAGLAPRP